MKKILVILMVLSLWGRLAKPARAVVNPLASDNNKVGVHILQPEEIEQAAKLVNGENGSWGYVTVPIQTTDRNREKWNGFMDKAREKKVIPIIRIATLVKEAHWEEPESVDLIAFANFLNDLKWPTKNRYIVVFNEVNRSDEFGGGVSPERYADILVNTSRIFKDRCEDFYILPAGLDLAAANGREAIAWREFWRQAYQHNPKIFEAVDGWTSHSYPNPGFVGKPENQGAMSIAGFKEELEFVSQYSDKDLPVFITETGWDQKQLGEERVAEYFEKAFNKVWSDVRIAAVTPFLLQAGQGPFVKFSLLDEKGQATPAYQAIKRQVTRGSPELANKKEFEILGVSTKDVLQASEQNVWELIINWLQSWENFFAGTKRREYKRLRVGNQEFLVEVADWPAMQGRGLSERSSLGGNEGMWFVFEEKERRSFWMKGMKFDLDIVWIKNGEVIGISRGNHKRPYKTYISPEPVDRVLEVRANSGIKPGDKVEVLN